MSDKPRVLVVYESMFGNSQSIAAAIADGIRTAAEVTLVPVGDAPARLPADVELLVVGGPTHAFGMSRPSTRTDASGQGELVMSPDTGIREWLDLLSPGDGQTAAATFDTRVTKVRRLPGSAARGAAKVLRRKGFPLARPAASFYVGDVKGPLDEGEIERARRWGEDLAHEVLSSSSPAAGR